MAFLVDPRDVTKFDRTDSELQLFWLFCIVVAGKTASTQARLLDEFLTALPVAREDVFSVRLGGPSTPFARIHHAFVEGPLYEALKASRLGQYGRLYNAMKESVTRVLDLRTCTVTDLEAVYGVGPKTARMFLMHTRPNQRVAALDTHVLKHLAANGHTVPKATPSSSRQYADLEQAFLALADAAGQSPADYDMAVWKQYSSSSKV
jgi:hypothetical protein